MLRTELNSLLINSEAAIAFLRLHNILKNNCICTICHAEMKQIKFKNIDNIIWSCQKRINGSKHNIKKSIRHNSIFFFSHLNLCVIVKLIFEWCNETPIYQIKKELKISKPTIIRWFFLFRRICTNVVKDWRICKIGNSNSIVEVDECQIGRRKYNRGREKEEIWVVGGIVRKSNPRICFLEIVQNRSMETLTDVICRNVNFESIIMTDEWKGYNNITKKKYTHLKINHSKHFVDPENPLIHTQNIENMWKILRKTLSKKTNYSRLNFEAYLNEFVYRSRIRNNIFEYFINNISSYWVIDIEEPELVFSEYEFI